MLQERVDRGAHVLGGRGAQLALCELRRLVQPLQGQVVRRQIDPLGVAEGVDQVVHQRVVESLEDRAPPFGDR